MTRKNPKKSPRAAKKAPSRGHDRKSQAPRGAKGKPRSGRKSAQGESPKPKQPIQRFAWSAEGTEILLRLEELLRERIHGKDEAIERIGRALRVRLTRLDFRPERPSGAFLLIGPPGVGKNEFAYALAQILYKDESAVVPIDLRGINSEEDVQRLTDTVIPGPPAILLEGSITTPVRRRPQSILLLRGIEQAHPLTLRLLQQILEQGWIDDASGRVSFDQTMIFVTSRIPDDEMGPTSEIGFNRQVRTLEERVLDKLNRRFGDEFLESFQEVIVLPPLSPEDVRRIARYKVQVVLQRLQKGKWGVEITDSVYQTFISDEEIARTGAGSLNRTLERKLLNPLARYLLEHPKERKIRLDVRDGALVIETTSATAATGVAQQPRMEARGRRSGRGTGGDRL